MLQNPSDHFHGTKFLNGGNSESVLFAVSGWEKVAVEKAEPSSLCQLESHSELCPHVPMHGVSCIFMIKSSCGSQSLVEPCFCDPFLNP